MFAENQSSLGPTQPDPNHIIMLSVPESVKPLTPDDDDVTPPENHFRSSPESDQRKRVRVSSQGRIDDEVESKKVRASTPVEETQPIKNVVVKTELIVLDDYDKETVILRDDSVGITRDQEPSQGRRFKGGLGSSNTDKCADKVKESVVNVGKNVGKEKASVDAVNGGLGSTKTDKQADNGMESIINVDGGLGSKNTVERRVQDNVLDVGNQKKVIKNGVNGNLGAGSSLNGFDEIDKEIGNKKQGRRKLPKSVQGREGNVGVEKELDFYGILEKLESQSLGDDGEEVDFVEMAKKRGTVFPRPRWWDPDW